MLPTSVQDKATLSKLRQEMREADTNHDGQISFQEFLMYFERMARQQAQVARNARLHGYGRSIQVPKSE